MADIQIVAEVIGSKKVNALVKSTQNLEARVKTLSKAYQSGKIGPEQYNAGLSELRKTAQKLYPTHQKASAVVTKLSKDYLAGAKAQEEAIRKQKEERASLQQYVQARRQATEENRRYDAEQKKSAITAAKAARENKKVADSYVRIKMAADPVYAAEVKLKQAQRDVITAYKQGNVTRREAVETMRQYRAAVQNGTLAGQGLNKGMNRMGVLFQQTGYQVGDFAVQVQSGTHMMVALGQQATQLVGTFGMLAKSTKMIALFSGLGIVVPIATAVLGAWMRTAENSADSASNLE